MHRVGGKCCDTEYRGSMKGSVPVWTVLLLGGVFLSFPHSTFAQVPCGNIIEPISLIDPSSPLITRPVPDCNDPFGVSPIASPYTLTIQGELVNEGETLTIPEGGTSAYVFLGEPLLDAVATRLFVHDGDDYQYIDTRPSVPLEADYRAFASQFFEVNTDIEPYLAAIFAGDYSGIADEMYTTLNNFSEYVYEHFVPVYPSLHAGTYTVVFTDYAIDIIGQRTFEKLFGWLIPTAHAQSSDEFETYVFTLTFTLAEESPTPTGISNILFLPGIQGSRLYTEEGGEENQVWEPFGNQDYVDLRMNDMGVSVNDVYTRDVIDEVYGVGGDIYKGFLQYLKDIGGVFEGPYVETFPYDWRKNVFDIVREGTKLQNGTFNKPTTTVAFLAGISPTQKVTIIAHSNGGLLAKALMHELEREGKADLVDKVIFIATPHIGTPKAIAALLHGYDQEQALNIPADAREIRTVMKNMPGVYGLLPSESYMSTLTDPLISFDNSSTTKLYRDRYGFTVSNMTEYREFLNGDEGRMEEFDTIFLPTKTNEALLNESLETHANTLDSWRAPQGVEVFNIVGIGLPTPKSIEYREFAHDYCGSSACVVTKLEPVVEFTLKGDETVVTKSAESVQTDSRIYINLFEESRGLSTNRTHADITESDSTQSLIDVILHGSSTQDIEHVTSTEPATDNNPITIDRIHSPARIYIEDSNGRRTGRDSSIQAWKEEIPDTDYYEIGGVKYLFKPANLNHRVVIEGEGSGIFTHGIDTLINEEQTTLHTLIASVTPTTRITYEYTNGTTGPVSVDSNSDGVTDYQLTIDGVLIETKVTYAELKTAIRNLKLVRLKSVVLLSIVTQAEQFYNKRTDTRKGRAYEKLEEGSLYLLDQTLIQFRKAKLITTDAYQGIKSIIDKLIKQ